MNSRPRSGFFWKQLNENSHILFLVLVNLQFIYGQADLVQLTTEAALAGQKEVRWPEGTYRLSTKDGTHLRLSNLTNMRIDARGVTIICTKVKPALALGGCTNVELIGLTIDYDPLPFTQGTVVAIDSDDRGFDLKVHEGYPPIKTEEGSLLLFDGGTRQWKAGTNSGGRNVKYSKRGDLIHVSLAGAQARHHVVKGDYVVQKMKQIAPHVVRLGNCVQTTLRDVTIHTGPMFAVLEVGCDAISYIGVRITPGPVPAGGTEARLMASTQDGIHSINARRGPRIEGCLIEAIGDDGIAIHGKYYETRSVNEALIVKGGGGQNPPFDKGETLRLIRESDGVIRGTGEIVSIDPFDDLVPTNDAAAETKSGSETSKSTEWWKIVTNPALSADAGDFIECPSRCGSGFIVKSNVIRNHRARGIIIKASDGVIEDNLIEHISLGGIVLAPEIGRWEEAGYSWNVTIARNRIVDCGYDYQFGKGASGMLRVYAPIMKRGAKPFAPAGGQNHIRILSNTIERSAGVNLLITSAKDVEVGGNRFIKPMQSPWPMKGGKPPASPRTNTVVWVDSSENVRFSDNKVEEPGAFIKEFIGLGAEVSSISGVAPKVDLILKEN